LKTLVRNGGLELTDGIASHGGYTSSTIEKLVEQGTVDAILKAIRTHKQDVVLERSACAALWNLSANYYIADQLVEYNAHHELVDMMPRVACKDLRNMTIAVLQNLALGNSKVLIEYGVLKVVTLEMAKNPLNAELQLLGCGLVANLCANSGRETVRGIVDQVRIGAVAAIKNHPTTIQQYGNMAIDKIAKFLH